MDQSEAAISGTPKVIYSDNAATFRLGEKLINEDIRTHEPSESLTSFLADREIDFIYITPLSPQQGGVYERIVGLVKHQLQKELGKTLLDFHSLRCVLAGTETMINSRLLTPHMRNTDDMVALRPIDFQLPGVLLELPTNKIPFDPKRSTTENRTRENLQKLDAVEEKLWESWALGYLLHLRESKHKNKRCSTLKPKVGQVVLINTNLVRRHKWPLGIITKVFHSKEGIRTAVVKCKGKLYERSVCHLIPLEIESVESQECTPDNENTDEDPGYKSIPNPPLPAIFDIPQAEYAPKRFKDSKQNFVPSAGNLPTIGCWEPPNYRDPEEEINYLDTEPADGEYRDPNATAKQIMDYGKNAVPDTRTREYLPRKAKAPYINYVHPTVFRLFSPSDRQQIVNELTALHPSYDLDNYIILGFSEVRTVVASVNIAMMILGVYGTPFVAFYFRSKILKILNTTKSYRSEKMTQTKSMIQGLTLQTLLPLFCYIPSFTYFIYAQHYQTDSLIVDFAVSPIGFIYTIFDPLLTIYCVLPYRRGNMEPRPMYVLLGVLAFTFPAYCRDYHDVIWNSRFFPQHLKHSPMNVRLGDQLTIICPKSFHRGMHYEYAKLYWVGKQDFDQCTHNTYYTKLMGVCANETETTATKMIFRKYNPIPNGIDFQIGEIYYIISTSSGHLEDINQPTGGLCWQENMKLAIRIVGEELPRMKYEVHDYQSLVSSSTSSPLASTMNSLGLCQIIETFFDELTQNGLGGFRVETELDAYNGAQIARLMRLIDVNTITSLQIDTHVQLYEEEQFVDLPQWEKVRDFQLVGSHLPHNIFNVLGNVAFFNIKYDCVDLDFTLEPIYLFVFTVLNPSENFEFGQITSKNLYIPFPMLNTHRILGNVSVTLPRNCIIMEKF
ncbi:hypothetical protein L3Y34_013460 [Caenorhabditis briggsae]|uniref:Ephrin-4 n=1 Tax=Caenorhabditis briggsae TaxID=6238 RepID=A0AAE9CWC6_CAEBR|nr:hypothetical protein L3Y34_013460 [Caenorhabditis briggsae]